MTPEIESLERQVMELKAQLSKARQSAEPQRVGDFVFATRDGDVRLSELFDGREDLIVVHNMGRSCPYCTLWADGLNGHVDRYLERAAFVVCSPDAPEVQQEFAKSRGWNFRMVSDASKEFTSAMGFWTEADGWWPGVSGFRLSGTEVLRTGRAVFGPDDEFCPVWPLFDLIGGPKGWEPRTATLLRPK